MNNIPNDPKRKKGMSAVTEDIVSKSGIKLGGKQCSACKHSIGYEAPYCAAFPSVKTPREIRFDEFDHRNPHPLDNGIHFEPEEGKRSPFE